MRYFAALVVMAGLAAPAAASGQADLIRTDPFDDDPLGIDSVSDVSDVSAQDLENSAARRAERRVRPIAGAVLTAISGVRETRHQVRVRLEDGVALVTTRMRFENRAPTPAELRYRLAVPEGVGIAHFKVCDGERPEGLCREAQPAAAGEAYDRLVGAEGRAGAAPIARARHGRDERGALLWLEAAPVPARGGLELELTYLSAAPLQGGGVKFDLPARGTDPRVAPAMVRVDGRGLLAPTIDGLPVDAEPAVLEAWVGAEIRATATDSPEITRSLTRFRCGDRRCARLRIAALPRPSAAADLVLLIDASPSTEGPVRGRVAPALAAILEAAPPGTTVRAVAFAARAQGVIERPTPAEDVPLLPLVQARDTELGSATRFEAALALVRSWQAPGRPTLVVVGDGGVTDGPASARAFERARREGLTVHVLNLADRPAHAALTRGAQRTGGSLIEAGREGHLANRGSPEDLVRRVRSLFAPIVAHRVSAVVDGQRTELGRLRAGEELTWLGPYRQRIHLAGLSRPGAAPDEIRAGLRHRWALRGEDSQDDWLAADDADRVLAEGGRCDAPLTGSLAGARRARRPTAAATPNRCAPAPSATPRPQPARPGSGVPAETVLGMLRQRVIPIARGCFRRDRRGRSAYGVRAEFLFTLADREIVQAEVRGALSPLLRSCLADAMDVLDVPRFEGRVMVRYPVHTQRDTPPPAVELAPETESAVRDVTRGSPSSPPAH